MGESGINYGPGTAEKKIIIRFGTRVAVLDLPKDLHLGTCVILGHQYHQIKNLKQTEL